MMTESEKAEFRSRAKRYTLVAGIPVAVISLRELTWMLDTIDELEIEVEKARRK